MRTPTVAVRVIDLCGIENGLTSQVISLVTQPHFPSYDSHCNRKFPDEHRRYGELDDRVRRLAILARGWSSRSTNAVRTRSPPVCPRRGAILAA
jgi:hypothetical protein